MAKRSKMGRPPAGLRPGEKSSEYHQLTLRMPPETIKQLDAIAGAFTLPRWKAVTRAVAAYVNPADRLSEAQLRAVRVVLNGQKAHKGGE